MSPGHAAISGSLIRTTITDLVKEICMRIPAAAALAIVLAASPIVAQSRKPAPQKIDDEYTRTIKQNLQDPRITTELVDHLPASDTVPSPLKFLGRAVGTPGELTYAKDIYRYRSEERRVGKECR